ncbi:MAG: efflux RND transporter permease subunit [Gammaproteobacteria bacterium]
MLATIIRTSLRYPLLVLMIAVLVVLYGSSTLLHANYDVFPEFVPAQADIQAEAPGLAPEDVERLVTQPLENAINGGANIDGVRSESIQGLSTVKVTFTEGTDVFRNRQLLAERVAEAATALPAGVRTPKLGPMTSSTMDLLKVGFTSRKLSGMELRTIVDWSVRPRVLAVPGVARAITYGGGRREIQVQVDPAKLAAFGVTMADVTAAATAATGVRGAGFIDTPNERILLSNVDTARTPKDIGAVTVTQRDGANLRLSDIAQVEYAPEPKFGDSRVQGEPDVLVSIGSQYGANTLEVTKRVESALAELAPMLAAQGVTVYANLHRPANFIEVALANVRDSLLLGAALVIVVLFVFLRSWRTALISFVTIPLAVIIAVIALDRFGWTLNTMTLGGLAVAIGVVVDDAIIDVENIVRRLRLASEAQRLSALDAIILSASVEVRRPIVLATLVVGVVFVPILFLPGIQGSFFAPLAAAFLMATFASLIIALTLTPALALLLLRGVSHKFVEPRWVRRLKLFQRGAVRRVSAHATAMLIVSVALGLVAVAVATRFGVELMPPFRESHFVAQVSAPPGLSLAEMTRVGENISHKMLEIPGIATVSEQVGRAEAGEDTWSPNKSEFHIELKPGLSGAEQSRIEKALRDVFDGFPGLQSEVVTFLGDRISESVSGETAAVSINIFGRELADIDRVAAEVAARVRTIPGAADVLYEASSDVPTLSITPRADRLAMFGLRPTEVFDAVAMAYAGASVTQVYEGNQSLAVRVLLNDAARNDPQAVRELLVRTVAGRLVPLGAVADVSLEGGRESIQHDRGQRRQVVTLNPESRDLGGFVRDMQAVLARDIKLPPDVYLEFGGSAQAAAAATRDLITHSAIATVVVVMVLLLAFGSWRTAGLVLANVPFALVGAVVAVALTGASLSIGTLVGFVTLFGISARNSIMLMSHYEHLVLVEGHRWSAQLARRGARERLTPILMTALVTALGVLPLALGNGEAGREIEGPMAIVILGGLVSSTLLNLLVMPAVAARFYVPGAAGSRSSHSAVTTAGVPG